MSNIDQTQYEALRKIAETLDQKIERIRRINKDDMATLTEDEEWHRKIDQIRQFFILADQILEKDISELTSSELEEITESIQKDEQ
jgi:hypothetical protein